MFDLPRFLSRPRTAAEWVARLAQGMPSAADKRALEVWLSGDPNRRRALEDALRVWGAAASLTHSQVARDYLANLPTSPTKKPPRMKTWALAGSGLAAAAFSLWLYVGPMSGRVYETPVGGGQSMRLADGSTVWLNTDSRVRVRFEKDERKVYLEKGEGFFSVAHDAGRPFIVTVDDHQVVVTGTQFNVLRRDAGFEVAVVEGHVRVEPRTARSGPAARLVAGDDALFDARKPAPVITRSVDTVQKAAWRQGEIHLENATLAEAVTEINRYSEVKLAIDSPAIAGLTLSGVFPTGEVDSFLSAVEQIYQVRARREGDRVYLERPTA